MLTAPSQCRQALRGLSVYLLVASTMLAVSAQDSPEPLAASASRRQTNRLAGQHSPYLLQHQHQPVDWHPWGPEAFEKALREDKPIFLSIGYSTCHWCHVMARESFDDLGTAELLNASFVCIKVDREERPDVDRVYMTYVQATTGGGGWPLSVFLTPSLQPFFGGTYYPPDQRDGRPGFPTLLRRVAAAWKDDRAGIQTHAAEVLAKLRETAPEPTAPPASPTALAQSALNQYVQSFDEESGGFGRAPKFPRPVNLRLLLRLGVHPNLSESDRKLAAGMVLLTLRRMASGGLQDHLEGGFHRYATDRNWQVPHFEKMLYDQAQIAQVGIEAFQFSRDPVFAEFAKSCLDYVLRQMTAPEGGFYSAEDADSTDTSGSHAEGAFYLWEASEIGTALSSPSLKQRVFFQAYGIQPGGNVPPENDPRGELKGRNILFRSQSDSQISEKHQLPIPEIQTLLSEARSQLAAIRSKRVRPHRDEKVLTAWNGLMISALAQASQVLGSDSYLHAARKAALFLQTHHVRNGRLLRTAHAAAEPIEAFADDHAFLIRGLLDLYEADFDPRWLSWAAELQEQQDALFLDQKTGSYFSTTNKDPHILLRIREEYDGAEPSANSVSALNLLQMGRLFENSGLQTRGQKVLSSLSDSAVHAPTSLPLLLCASLASSLPHTQLVVTGNPAHPQTKALLQEARSHFLPEKILLLAHGKPASAASRIPALENFHEVEGKPAAYLCTGSVCKPPVRSPDELRFLLGSIHNSKGR